MFTYKPEQPVSPQMPVRKKTKILTCKTSGPRVVKHLRWNIFVFQLCYTTDSFVLPDNTNRAAKNV